MISGRTAGVVAGVAGTLFIGYCIYFDRKRRNDPLFKQKLRERRKKANQNKTGGGGGGAGPKDIQLPDLNDAEAVQKFFLQQVQMGEELLAQGDFENGVEHLSNAVAVCGQPQQLLQVLHQTLPSPVFQLLVQKLPATTKRIKELSKAGGSGVKIQEVDDLE